MIKEFNSQTLKALRVELQSDLDALELKYGLKFHVGNMTYSDTVVTIKVDAGLGNTDATKHKFKEYAARFGLKPSDYGKIVYVNGSQYKISGIKPKAHRYPIVMQNTDTGKMYKFPQYVVKDVLEAANE